MIPKYPRGKLAKRFQYYLRKDKNLKKVVPAVQKDFANSNFTAHNWEHIWRDALNAIVIGEAEKADMSIVLPAAIMHDIGFLYKSATGKTHGKIGAKKLPSWLKKHKINYSKATIAHIAECIRTHKGSMHGERPITLEAKVVADADMLEKFGAFGIYQEIRTFTEYNYDIEHIIDRKKKLTPTLTLQTKTGRKMANRGRKIVAQYFDLLDKASEPYRM